MGICTVVGGGDGDRIRWQEVMKKSSDTGGMERDSDDGSNGWKEWRDGKWARRADFGHGLHVYAMYPNLLLLDGVRSDSTSPDYGAYVVRDGRVETPHRLVRFVDVEREVELIMLLKIASGGGVNHLTEEFNLLLLVASLY